MTGNGYCNDETNNPECSYDGGDCCGSCINTDYCTHCTCIGEVTGNGVSNALVGDGHCNDEMNTAECNFDGSDCCGQCDTISVTLENNALAAQGSKEGIYHNSSMVNGKASWTSTSLAIWYDQEFNDWSIGFLDDIGENVGGIYSDDSGECPFDLPSEKWVYWYNNGWTSAETNESKVDCLKGNFPEYLILQISLFN